MEHFKKFLLEQAKLHTSMLPQDVVKLCYQATFGAEHLLMNREKAFTYFRKEYETTPANTLPIVEPICDSYVRCNLSAWKQKNIPSKWLFELFYRTASKKSAGTEALFWEYINKVESLFTEHIFSFSKEAWAEYITEYKKQGIRAVHHSEAYRKNEMPAYRLLDSSYAKLLPILERLALIQEKHKTVVDKKIVIAIDGRAGAGKSTLAQILSDILDAPIIQMDDFFLPPVLRTSSRLNESGGNVHYERFCEEVVPFLKENVPFSYRCFDCRIMDYNGKKEIVKSPWCIVEGSYSMHPSFGTYMDYAIFCDVSSEEQFVRIRLRNGDKMLQRFVDTWIPMEEQYFETEQIRERCDSILYL